MNVLRRMSLRWLLVLQLLLFFWLALNSLVADSPTMDEQNHLARGLAFLGTGDARLSLEHPPLINSLSALPVHALLDVRLPTDHPSWERPEGWYEFADLLLWHYNHDVARMIFLARLPIVLLGMGLALVGFHFARLLWGGPGAASRGRLAGILAAFFLLFDPNIMAHGRYTTTDLGAACFVLLAAALLGRLWRAPTPTPGHLLAASGGLALAFGSKLSTLVFVPSFILLALMPLYGHEWHWRAAWRRLLQLIAAGAGALLLLWLFYGFQWGSFFFRSAQLAPLNRFAGPMPTYWAGIEQILFVSGGSRPAFLLGETSTKGFVAYFPLAFLVKTPLAMLLLLALALGVLGSAGYTAFRRRRASVETGYPVASAIFVLVPAVFYFLASMTSNLNIGYRHLLPILPLLYLFVAGTVAHVLQLGVARRRQDAPVRALRSSIALLLAAFFLSTLAIHPHYIGYFNLLAGGPANGYRILGDSNVDWGQDLLRLQDWLQENGVDRVKLSWFGSANPAYYGINYDPLPGLPRHYALWHQPPSEWPASEWPVPYDPDDPPAGIYAISATMLGEMYRTSEMALFTWFRAQEPIARIGNSIFIYQVPADGPPAHLVLPHELQLQGALAPFLDSNDVRVRRLDPATTFIWPASGGWLAVPDDLQPGSLLAPFWPTIPTTTGGGQTLYRLEALQAAEDALDLTPPSAGDAALDGTPLHFLGYRDVTVEAETIELMTAWQVAQPEERPLKLFIHALDAEGNMIAQWDGLDLAPNALLPGDRFVHVHRLAVPGSAVAQLAAGVYDGETLERLSDYLILSTPGAD